MKKLLSIVIVVVTAFALSILVSAKNGDVVGHIYSTDIRAYVNGIEVQSYNIGGRTAIVIEEILNANQYIYDDSTRTLKFFSLNSGYLIENISLNKTISGNIIGDIYETDIITSIYDVVVPSYNILGKTAVLIEDLGYDGAFSQIGGKYIWNAKERTISLEFMNNNQIDDYKTRQEIIDGKIEEYDVIETDIGVGRSAGQPPMADQTESRDGQYEYQLISGEDTKTVSGFFAREYYYADMLPLAETFDFFNINYSFENNILHIDTSDARPFNYQLTETTTDVLGESQIEYLNVDKVMLNGNEAKITYSFISGHFDNTSQGRAQAKPYVCNGKVYINSSFISWLYE